MRWTVRQMMVRVAILALILAPVAWLGKAVQQSRRAARESQCSGHLTQIALALYNYHDVYGTLPPAYLPDAEGRPAHSWRVLILPFLEQQQLYERYDLAEPWDGPNNRKLAPSMPRIYSCPNHRGDFRDARYQGAVWTSYLAITGPGTAFPGAGMTSLDDLPAHAILVAEVANADIPWLAPIDLDVRTMPLAINGPRGPGISSKDPAGPIVMLADGTRRRLAAGMPPAELRRLLTAADMERIEPSPPSTPRERP